MRVCLHRDECMHVYMSTCVCTVLKKKLSLHLTQLPGPSGHFLVFFKRKTFVSLGVGTGAMEKHVDVDVDGIGGKKRPDRER